MNELTYISVILHSSCSYISLEEGENQLLKREPPQTEAFYPCSYLLKSTLTIYNDLSMPVLCEAIH